MLTNQFPYGIGESFLENEIKFLSDSFDTILVLSKDTSSTTIRFQADHFFHYRINPRSSLAEVLLSPILLIRHLRKSFAFVREELRHSRQRKKTVTLRQVRKMTHDLFKALVISRHIKRIVRKHGIGGRITFYSYWLNPSALATLFVSFADTEVKRIARAHRIDLYEEEHPDNYLPFRSVLASRLDKIYTISTHGYNYLTKLVGNNLNSKIQISRLGTPGHVSGKQNRSDESHLIVSCSFLRETKRVHLIVEALAHITSVNVHWIHFGDGHLRNSLEQLAKSSLSSKGNIRYIFYGEIINQELHHFYSENYVSLFINTSASEGIPVTIMEAMSYGIPVIAPNVGGVSELVSEENGFIYPKDYPAEKIALLIGDILAAPPAHYQALRARAYNTWNTRYNADRNFSTFVADLLSL